MELQGLFFHKMREHALMGAAIIGLKLQFGVLNGQLCREGGRKSGAAGGVRILEKSFPGEQMVGWR